MNVELKIIKRKVLVNYIIKNSITYLYKDDKNRGKFLYKIDYNNEICDIYVLEIYSKKHVKMYDQKERLVKLGHVYRCLLDHRCKLITQELYEELRCKSTLTTLTK